MAKKEMSMEIRLLIAFVLMGLVLFLTPYFYKQPVQPAAAPPAAAPAAEKSKQVTEANAAKPEVKPELPKPLKPAAPVPGEMKADQEETKTVDTDAFTVVFS